MTACTTNTLPLRPARRLSAWTWLRAVFAVRQQRRNLANLDAHLLIDIGIDADAARTEARRKPWDVPQNWLK